MQTFVGLFFFLSKQHQTKVKLLGRVDLALRRVDFSLSIEEAEVFEFQVNVALLYYTLLSEI